MRDLLFWMRSSASVPLFLVAAATAFSCNGPGSDPGRTVDAAVPDSLSMALLDLEQRIISDASNPALYAERAALYLAYDSTRQAENDLLRSIALDSMNAEYHLRLGEIYYLTLQLDKALSRFERTIVLDDKNTEARLKLAEMQLVLRQYARSMEMVNDALRIDPYVAHGYYLKGWIHKEIGDTTLSISRCGHSAPFAAMTANHCTTSQTKAKQSEA